MRAVLTTIRGDDCNTAGTIDALTVDTQMTRVAGADGAQEPRSMHSAPKTFQTKSGIDQSKDEITTSIFSSSYSSLSERGCEN